MHQHTVATARSEAARLLASILQSPEARTVHEECEDVLLQMDTDKRQVDMDMDMDMDCMHLFGYMIYDLCTHIPVFMLFILPSLTKYLDDKVRPVSCPVRPLPRFADPAASQKSFIRFLAVRALRVTGRNLRCRVWHWAGPDLDLKPSPFPGFTTYSSSDSRVGFTMLLTYDVFRCTLSSSA